MDKHRERRYGLTPVQFAQMKEDQENRCFLCGRPEPGHRMGVQKELAVDHNRTTGIVRKLLCSACNTSIGALREDVALLQRMIDYLNTYK
jgi:hypothetical protein